MILFYIDELLSNLLGSQCYMLFPYVPVLSLDCEICCELLNCE